MVKHTFKVGQTLPMDPCFQGYIYIIKISQICDIAKLALANLIKLTPVEKQKFPKKS
jgi:hypothetical protein